MDRSTKLVALTSVILATVALVVSLAAFLPAVAQADEMVTWLSDYGEALAEARRTGKPIFLEYRCSP